MSEELENMNLPEHTYDMDEGGQDVEAGYEEENPYEGLEPMEARELRLQEKAAKQGWKPFEEWDGDPDDWVSAETFVVRGELFDQNRQVKKQLKEAQDVIQQIADHNRRLMEKEREEEITELRKKKALAYENEDFDQVVDIDENLNKLRNAPIEEEDDKPNEPEANPEFEDWVARPENQWYVKSRVMRGAADALAVEYAQDNPNATFEEAVKYVEAEMRKEFPEKFGKRKPAVSGVNQPSMNGRAGSPASKNLARRLSPEQRKIGEKFVRQGAVSDLNQYAEELKKLGDL